MPNYRVDDAGVRHAQQLIDAGQYDDQTPWSDAAPSTGEENEEREDEGQQGYAEWHLAVDPDEGEGTKGRHRFPYGDFEEVNRAALIHAEQRASQNDHEEIRRAAKDLLDRLDATRS
ncbi:hypothetical protein [Modestobacter roseus]|uniref:hypothetical protein n=1 Tax=Modestobacter roseus TaxID=1181884 RepID=UPI0034DFFF45